MLILKPVSVQELSKSSPAKHLWEFHAAGRLHALTFSDRIVVSCGKLAHALARLGDVCPFECWTEA